MNFGLLNKKSLWTAIVKIILATGAFIFIAFKIVDQVKRGQLFKLEDIQPIYLFFVFILLFANWFIESLKWKNLTRPFQILSIDKSIHSVLTGLTVSLFTPNRIGEFAGRIINLHPENRLKGTMATWIGSYSQILAILFFSTVSGFIVPLSFSWVNGYLPLIRLSLVLVFIVGLSGYFFIDRWIGKIRLKRFEKFNPLLEAAQIYPKQVLFWVLILSVIRYLVFAVQFYLILCFTGIDLSFIPAFCAISFIYISMTLIPTIALAELGIRGSLALVFLSPLAPFPAQIVATTILIWIINIALPALTGVCMIYRTRIE
jgi:uncharacterized membrane protein YbhN (UPF0104 family)